MPHLTPHHKGRHPPRQGAHHGWGVGVGGPLNANIDIWALFDTKKRENEPLAISNQKNLTEIKKTFSGPVHLMAFLRRKIRPMTRSSQRQGTV